MLLHKDALRMLLPMPKNHLESVQVCLGEIDEWTMKLHKMSSKLDPGRIYLFVELHV